MVSCIVCLENGRAKQQPIFFVGPSYARSSCLYLVWACGRAIGSLKGSLRVKDGEQQPVVGCSLDLCLIYMVNVGIES